MTATAPKAETDPESLSASIYAELRVRLITGALKPAEAVSIRKLADSFGVSAMPVREALRQLASEGALNSAARKAYRVPDLTAQQASDLFFVRGVLEGAAAEIAATRITANTLTRLEKYVVKMENLWKARDATGFLLANYKFHSTIYQCSGNSALALSIDRLYVQTGPWLAHGIINLVNPDNWLGEHTPIIEALRKGDAKTARQLMEEDAFWGVELYRHTA
ncbi:GntR family transcriptional regulator [Paracoccus seriniphilus]|uniref:Transcriptional regulator, GntR family n=1 Tax=Paracoccus seriniphilus TaxID=184748 RepID=A0A239PVD4_9RHOB|nr:GntR family transcriptional regulator [Paracoccus seriniphilus]WCR15407.1 GntR family transcriptional regulator [Paracoccus seriniphilus]SNT73896.1 transcriptional regulator, GntR family [Paracoccus seriniphilus]